MRRVLRCVYPLCVFLVAFLTTYIYLHLSTNGLQRPKPKYMVPTKDPVELELAMDAGVDIEEIDIPSYDMDITLMKAVDKLVRRESTDLKPVNLKKFRYMLTPGHKCDFRERTTNFSRVLVLVKSAPDHQRLRRWLRLLMNDTIGILSNNVKMFFLLGYSRELNNDIRSESEKYDDIIQKNFIDSYRNLTYKTQMAYEWASMYCSSADFVLFQDDDFFANIKNVVEFLSEQLTPEELFTGHVVEAGSTVIRDRASKWFVSNIAFSNNLFPAYFPGGSYIASSQIVERLSFAFPFVPVIPVDDVYVGLVSSKLGITMKHSHRFYFSDCQNWSHCLACKAFL